jgi:CHAT domain-containing protein/Tfp pilus assembly protein PilF
MTATFRASARGLLLLAASVLLLSPLPAALAASDEPEWGAVVAEVAPASAGEKAGIRPGDLIQSWSREGEKGDAIRSPFDLRQIEIEQAPRGAVTLRGTREGQNGTWTLPAGSWGIRARPTLPDALLVLYRQGQERIAAGELAPGAERWRSAVEAARGKDPLRAAWLASRLAGEFAGAKRWPEADAAWESALQLLKGGSKPAAAQVLRDWSEAFQQRSAWDRAVELLRQALALEPEDGLPTAWDLNSLGTIASRRGDLAAAKQLFAQASAIRERLAPESLESASSSKNLGIVAARQGDLEAAEERFLKALAIEQRLNPDGPEIAKTLLALGNVAMYRSDLPLAEERTRLALDRFQRLSPDSADVATALSNLGIQEMRRGDLASSEEHTRRSLVLREKLAPESLDLAASLHNLAIVAEQRGDLTAAEEHDRLALGIRERLAPGSPDLAQSYHNLAAIEDDRHDVPKAQEYLRRALAIQEKISPQSYDTASTYVYMAILYSERGDLKKAEELHGRALAILQKQSPESLAISDSLENLGNIALRRGELKKAGELFQHSLAIREKLAPGSARNGTSLNRLGQVERRLGHLPQAAERLCAAIDVLDRQREKLGGTAEGRSNFAGIVMVNYLDCMAAKIDLGRPEEAFSALERGRSRSFLDLLSDRDLRLAELPAELARDRRQADADYDHTQTALSRLSPERDREKIDRLLVELREIQARQEEIAAKIRQASPKAAALHHPRPLDLAGARSVLDPGTLLLEYAVGPKKTWLFAVEPADAPGPGLSVFQIPIGEAALRKEVASFRRLLARPNSERPALQAQARRLYSLLVRPAEKQIAGAKRILVSPDGPLHTLSFAALMRDKRYLAEWKPLHSVLSATVYAELRRSRPVQRERREERVDAFGNPFYPRLAASDSLDPVTREILQRGAALTPIPSTRKEVEAIATLYPQSHTYLGREATEEKAKTLGTDSRLIHFACHGLLDERFPLNSALALTVPEHPVEGQDNGLLQAWEIFESVHLDADLVTLSACDTALGKEMGGEGLVGLTRAFQYAGARSVLASLWGVADYSTARFMERFYRYLRDGKSKDEALRAAQIDQIRQKGGSSHPFFWAAFELNGDWR